MINRRTLVGAAAAGLVARSHATALGDAKGRPTIGRLSEGGPALDDLGIFRAAMRDLGHPDVVIEHRFAQGQKDRLAAMAAELVRPRVDVIWVAGTRGQSQRTS